jgi:hypothetical protein
VTVSVPTVGQVKSMPKAAAAETLGGPRARGGIGGASFMGTGAFHFWLTKETVALKRGES